VDRSDDRQPAGLNAPAFLALGCIGFIASAPAMAQDAQPANGEKRLGGMTVTDTVLDDEGYKVERVESPKAVAPLLDTPRSIVVVDKQIIKDTGAATLVDALRTVPGITFGAAEGGNPIGDRPFIRGFDSQGSTYLDGVRDIGAQTREIFAVEQIQVVRGSDSTLGGRGSAGGSLNVISKLPQRDTSFTVAGSAGTADYKRVTGDANVRVNDMIAVRLAAMWHDQDVAGRDQIFQKRWGIAPSITIGMESDTKLTLSYYHLDTDELPDSGIPFLYTIGNTPNLGYSYSEPALGDITTMGGVTGHVSRKNFYGIKERDFRDSKTDQAAMRIEHEFDGGIKLRNTSRYSHTYQAYSFLLPDDSQGNVYGTTVANTGTNVTNGGYVWTRSNNRYGYTDSITNQTDLYGTFETGSIKHSFAIGAELSWEKARRGAFVTRGFTNAAGNELLSTGSTLSPRCNTASIARAYCVSLFDPQNRPTWINYASDTSNVAAPIVKNLPIAETRNDANTQSVYAFDSVTLTEQLILNLGLRYDSFKSTVRPGVPIASQTTFALTRKDDIFNYQAGLVFKPTANTSLYASYATAATPPNSLLGEGQEQNGLGTTNTAQALAILDSLKVEKTKSMEVGAKAELFGGGLSLSGAVFQTKTKNARTTVDANTVAFIGERRIRGVELGWTGNITDEWSVTGGYTYLDAKIVDGGVTAFVLPAGPGAGGVGTVAARTVYQPSVNTGRQFPQTAKHSFTLWSNYQVTTGLSVGGGAFYMSRQFGGYQDNRAVTGTGAAATVTPATKVLARTIPGYWRFDARVGYTFNDRIDLAVNVQNLTNKTYFTQVYTSHYASIAPSRSAFATLTFKY
jgi:catecholate siderophore receptor